jgi:hypothetical protein
MPTGEPWQECGFQSFAMNEDGSRVLTVSSGGRIQLWDGEGSEVTRLDWPDEWKSGANGYPDARTLIVGDTGIAVTHYNQLALIRLSDGKILAQRILDIMTVEELRAVAPGRILVEVRDRDWKRGVRELVLPGGELRDLPAVTDLMRTGHGYWVTGARPPFVIHRAGAEDVESPRSCMPGSARFCFWRDENGRLLHAFDMVEGRWRSVETGGFDQFTMTDFVDAGGLPFVVLCRPTRDAPVRRRPCSIVDFRDGRRIYEFEAETLRALGAFDEQGRPEIRLALFLGEPGREQRREDRRVSIDGAMRVIDPKGRANLNPPGGGLILPGEAAGTSLLIDSHGQAAARLPFSAQACGDGWPSWTGYCRISADGRRWLVPVSQPVQGGSEQDERVGLTMYGLPAAGR